MRIKPDPFVIGTNFRNNGPLGSAEDGSVFIVDPHMSGQKAAEGQHYGYISKALNYDVNENEVIEDNRGSSFYFQEGIQIAAVEGSDLGGLSSSVDYINGFRDSVVTFSDKSSMKIYIATRSLQNGGTYLDISDSHLELVQKYIADNGVRITSVKLGYWDNTEWDRFSIEAFDGELQQPPCFVRGTLIRTQDGTAPVEELRPGQMVWTLDHGLQKILWLGIRKLNADELAQCPEWCPISLPVSAIDGSDSEHRLNVSPQHRILVDSAIAETMFGKKQVLVPAKALLSLPGAKKDEQADSVEYWHILLEHHAILEADGVLTELSIWENRSVIRSKA
ncbi:Hint domain-containing protein [Paracoccus aerodenitrificans]|uniref:Hint domain-containing protein n=1 Tax=Paracoccus aerodenitrificans TaxID=3017781 RepID=UPI0022F00A79|nr:Hint domain-containing protein [Paracoccus aerodenitrificans]WBU65144.1 Hint domain-containing protein [Paracoccus aerodenitrificans]